MGSLCARLGEGQGRVSEGCISLKELKDPLLRASRSFIVNDKG
jgi:hypothetical protein